MLRRLFHHPVMELGRQGNMKLQSENNPKCRQPDHSVNVNSMDAESESDIDLVDTDDEVVVEDALPSSHAGPPIADTEEEQDDTATDRQAKSTHTTAAANAVGCAGTAIMHSRC